MKCLTALFFLVFTLTAAAQGVGRNYISSTGTVKSRVQEKIVVVNSAAAALTVGEFACLDLTADDGISVDYCSFGGAKAHCMILDSSCAVGARCSCLVKGYTASAAFGYNPTIAATAGQVVYATIDGTLFTFGDAATSAPNNVFPVGVTLDSKSAAGDLEVFVDL